MTPKNLIEKVMAQWRIVLTLCLILVAFGVWSFFTMQRQEFPDFTVRQGLVVGVMPGASTAEVESQLTRPVEDYLFSFKEVNKKKTYSVSREGQVVVFVELGDEVKGVEAPAFWAKLRHGLNELKGQLPGGVLALIGNNDFGDTSAVLFTLMADGRSPRDLDKYLEVLEAQLRKIDATSKLRRYGAREEVIRITLSRERLTRYGIRPASLWATLQGLGGAPLPARLDGDELERPIHVTKTLRSEAELADTVLLAVPDGPSSRLRDVADISREYGHDDAYVRFNGKTAMVLSIEMQSGNDITRFGDQIDAALAATKAELPPGVTIARVADQPKVVRTSVNHFLRDFLLAIVSVIAVTLLLLPIRVASVAAVTIPISIAVTLGVLNALGVQLQTVSLAGLVVVLGMVVDNAIVVIDDHVDKLDQGLDPWTAAWKSGRDLAVPVLAATVAIILSYVPMPVFVKGTAGDFIGSLPLTIAVALTTSLLVALFLLPAMNAAFIRRGLHQKDGKRSLLDLIQKGYDRIIEAAFRHPWLTLSGGVASVVAAGVMAAHLPQQMFPKIERNQFAVEVYLPNGRSLKQTDQVIRRIEEELLADRRVANVTAFVGTSSPRFHTVYAPHMPSRSYGQLLVNTVDEKSTEAVLGDCRTRLAGAFPEAWVQWKQLEMQPGSPVEVRLSGDDPAALKRAAFELEAFARGIPGTAWVRDDWEEALQTIEVVPDAEACSRLGVPPAMLQASLAIGSVGFPVATLWEGDYPVKVLLKDEGPEVSTLEGLRQQTVSSALGAASVPLQQLAEVRPAWQEGAVVRRNGVRTLTVQVDVAPGTLGSEVQKVVEAHLAAHPPAGATVSYGGEKDLAAEVMGPMSTSMVVSIGLIFLVILFQFQRFRKSLVVMLAMPLCFFGAVLGMFLAGYPFSLTAFMGVIGLIGIVVRNGIILVTYAEELRREKGLDAREAALAAGKRRMRPIYLTSMAAAIGVIPMILSRSTLWGPMGTVTCFGLLAAMLLTLLVLPVAYWLMMRGEYRREKRRTAEAAGAAALLLAVGLLALPGPARAEEGYTLARCKALALEHNASVVEAGQEVAAARETKEAAYTHYFPQVSVTAGALAAIDPLMKMESAGGNLPVYDGNPQNLPTATEFAYMPPTTLGYGQYAFMAAVQVMQPVYTGGRVVAGNRLAEVGAEAAQDKLSLARRDAVAQTEEKYWRIQTLSGKQQTLEAFDVLLQQLEKQVADARQAGLITHNDELKVALQRKQVEVDRVRLADGRALALRDLAHHLGLAETGPLSLADALAAPVDPAGLEKEKPGGLERRVELRLLNAAVRAERLQIDLKRGEMLPAVSVGAAAFHLDAKGLASINNAMVLGVANVPLSNVWEGLHAVEGQRRRVEMAERKLEDVRALLALQIDKAWDDLASSWRTVQVAQSAVEQAEVNLGEETDRHANGLSPFSDVLEAQVKLRKAQDGRVDAWADYWIRRAEYLRSVGQEAAAAN